MGDIPLQLLRRQYLELRALVEMLIVEPASVPLRIVVAVAAFVGVTGIVVAAYKAAVAALVPFAAGTAFAVDPVGSVGVAAAVVVAAAVQT